MRRANHTGSGHGAGVPTPSRRTVVAASGTALAALAGCLGGDDEAASVGTAASEHPVSAVIDEVPARGADPFEAAATLVVYDDPRCPRCQAFHEDAVSRFERDFGDDGSLVYVPYPVTYPDRGRAAWNVLLAAHDVEASAFWVLQDRLIGLGAFSVEDVYETAGAVLSDRVGDDEAGAAVGRARDGEYDGFIDESIDVAEAAGASGTTPYASVFAGDRHVGSESDPGYGTIDTLLDR